MLSQALSKQLKLYKQQHLTRERPVLQGAQQVEVSYDNKQYLSFCSNNYLGLANHPAVIAAVKKAADCYGVGSCAAQVLGGYSYAHQALEEELAEFLGFPRVLLFTNGYTANIGIITTFCQAQDAIFIDRYSHASIIDAACFSGASIHRYPHINTISLEKKLAQSQARYKLIATDGVFSADGSIAPIDKLITLAKAYQAELLIDDAHGFGVIGVCGRGILEHLQTQPAVIYMGTLSKALGTFGAFVAADTIFIDALIQFARANFYTIALPPILAEASRASLKIIQCEPWRLKQLQAHIHYFQQSAKQLELPISESETAIQPLILGSSERALRVYQRLQMNGIWVGLMRPPSVPKGTARLRIILTAAHSKQQIDRLLSALRQILNEV